MNDFQLEFPATSLDSWKAQITKELKDNASKINFIDAIEEINLDITKPISSSFPLISKNETNDWKISIELEVEDEKASNKKALTALNQGNNELIFKLKIQEINWDLLFENIEVQFIHTRLNFTNKEQFHSFLSSNFSNQLEFFAFDFDPILPLFNELKEELIQLKSTRVVAVNGFELQQLGATTWQEIGTSLSTAHELLNSGVSPNQITFNFGIGSNYFLEIAKLRAFNFLWNQLTDSYGKVNNSEIVAHIGWTNKSLIDPHTNLLRQTTEAMAAVAGGASSLVVHAYDVCSTDGASDFANRMATNISNLLKEESYFDKVIDPLSGSYVIENLTELLIEKGWNYFLELDAFKSLNSKEKIEKIKQDMRAKATERIAKFKSNETKLIGMNLFNKENPSAQTWKSDLSYLGVPYLIYELNV